MSFITKLSTIFLVLCVPGCEEEKILKGTPECIQMKIHWLSRHMDDPGKVYSYLYEGKTVYFFSERCCDIFSELYDKDCNLICAPSGGFGGGGDGKCRDFFDKSTNEILIWEGERK